jgi:hypothetical protein
MRPIYVTSLALATLTACASAPEPKERVASSRAAMRSAEEMGARHVPAAALHLQLANEQADFAKALIQKGDNERAGWVLMRAEADAELALALARESSLRAEAHQAMDKVRALKQQSDSHGS